MRKYTWDEYYDKFYEWANCPPHYGYRYGRWYYGHDHVQGCEFGGNKGSGSMD